MVRRGLGRDERSDWSGTIDGAVAVGVTGDAERKRFLF